MISASTRSPAKPRRSQAERVALSDRRLTEAAIQLLVERGVEATTLQALGERSGYSRGLVTHRFGTKSGLFTHVLTVCVDSWLQRLQSAVGMKIGIDALRAATECSRQFVRERPDEVRAMYLLWFQSIDPGSQYRTNVARVHRAQRRDVARWIIAGQQAGQVAASVDPLRFSEQYVAATNGILFQWMVNPRVPFDAMLRQLEQDLSASLAV